MKVSRRVVSSSYVLCLFLVLLTGMLYASSISGVFFLDDDENIVRNPAVKLTRLSLAGLLRAARESPLPSRPLSNMSFALSYLISGEAPWGYHLVNIAVHALSAIALFLSLELLLRSRSVALATAACWLASPVHVETITYVVQRMTALAGMFSFFALYFVLRGTGCGSPRTERHRKRRSSAWLSVAALAFVAACASKESAVLLPLLIGYGLYSLGRVPGRRLVWLLAVPVAAVILERGLGGAALLLRAGGRGGLSAFGTALRGFAQTASLLLLPLPGRLGLEHDPHVGLAFTSLSVLVASGIVALAWRFRRRRPLVSVGLVWFSFPLFLEILAVHRSPVVEQRLYFPAAGLLLTLAAAMPKRWFLLLAFVATAASAPIVVARNRVYHDEVTLASDVAAKAPGSIRAAANLVIARFRAGESVDEEFARLVERPLDRNLDLAIAGRTAVAIGRYGVAVELFEKELLQGGFQCEPCIGLARAYSGLEQDRQAAHFAILVLRGCRGMLPGDLLAASVVLERARTRLRLLAGKDPSAAEALRAIEREAGGR